MSVAEIKLAFTGRDWQDKIFSVRDYTSVYLVRTDNANDSRLVVVNGSANGITIPVYGNYYNPPGGETDRFSFLISREAELLSDDSNLLWKVTCKYSTTAYNDITGLIPVFEPFGADPIVEWDFHEDKEAAYYAFDRNDNPTPIVNSAGDQYDPPLEFDFTRMILKVTKNLSDYDPLVALRYANTVNSDNWLGFPKWTILCKPFRGRLTVDKGFVYWTVSYEFHFDFRTWQKQVPDAGLREFVTKEDIDRFFGPGKARFKNGPGYYHLKNEDGTFVTEPQLLNGHGHRLVPAGGVLTPNLASEGFTLNRFRLHRQLPFIPLGVL